VLSRLRWGITGVIAALIVLLTVAGCGSKPAAETKQTPEEIKLINQVSDFSSKVDPIFKEAEDSYKKLTKAITDFGYGNIKKDQLQVVVNETLAATRDVKVRIDKVEVPSELTADLDEVKSGLATAVWLREQKYPKLAAALQKPNPKSSELNAILAELKSTEAFLTSGQNKLTEVKQRYGIN